jgi:hypothetical protein
MRPEQTGRKSEREGEREREADESSASVFLHKEPLRTVIPINYLAPRRECDAKGVAKDWPNMDQVRLQ